ncbi:hypothetical protein PAXRUDRAFT_9003 [Paxillus rubicundulus Ve08.2h10]|uniref:Uncharacterized protein n=1 Tax=Paxillus rubicundulus Ve08.2h10 TaxID=930991 RepID=A0A0D0E9B2_9AGAM|nr:hypothetical protein PAXRUDRAFT_9003 [Paxillus rubicundulus Ve08.2h10]
MSSSITNNLTKWSNKQLHKHKDNSNKLYERKSMKHRCCMKVHNELEHWRAEEEARQKAEEAKCKAEKEVWRIVEAEAKAHTEEIAWAQSSVAGPSKGKQLKLVVSGAGRGPSPVLWVLGHWGSM